MGIREFGRIMTDKHILTGELSLDTGTILLFYSPRGRGNKLRWQMMYSNSTKIKQEEAKWKKQEKSRARSTRS
jgi:hypothetical protein